MGSNSFTEVEAHEAWIQAWRVAYAYLEDHENKEVLLIGTDKSFIAFLDTEPIDRLLESHSNAEMPFHLRVIQEQPLLDRLHIACIPYQSRRLLLHYDELPTEDAAIGKKAPEIVTGAQGHAPAEKHPRPLLRTISAQTFEWLKFLSVLDPDKRRTVYPRLGLTIFIDITDHLKGVPLGGEKQLCRQLKLPLQRTAPSGNLKSPVGAGADSQQGAAHNTGRTEPCDPCERTTQRRRTRRQRLEEQLLLKTVSTVLKKGKSRRYCDIRDHETIEERSEDEYPEVRVVVFT